MLLVPKPNQAVTPEEKFRHRNCLRNRICGQNADDQVELSRTSFCNLNGAVQGQSLLLPNLPTVAAKRKFYSNHNGGARSQPRARVRVLVFGNLNGDDREQVQRHFHGTRITVFANLVRRVPVALKDAVTLTTFGELFRLQVYPFFEEMLCSARYLLSVIEY